MTLDEHMPLIERRDSRVDPRTAILSAVAMTGVVLALDHYGAMVVACAFGAAACAVAWVPLATVIVRLVAINVFMALVVVLLPWSVPGQPLALLGPLTYSLEGFQQAFEIVVKGNAIALWLTAFFARLDPVRFGQGLAALGMPAKLAALFLLTVRYVAVIGDEYLTLRRAMAVRAFRPRLNLHTLRSYGYLVGMLLVRALERSERVYAAMRCRGFNGALPKPQHMVYSAVDAAAFAGVATVCATVLWMDWA